MYCCKKNVHACWFIQAWIQFANKQQIDLLIHVMDSLIMLPAHVNQNQQLTVAGNVQYMPTKHVNA